MLVGTVEEVGPESPLGLARRRPRRHPGLADPDAAGDRGRPRALGRPRRAGARRRLRHPLRPLDRRDASPTTCPPTLSLAVMDVCGAPALTRRVVEPRTTQRASVAVIGGAGKSGSLSLAAARDAGATRTIGVVPARAPRPRCCATAGWPTTSWSPTPATRSRCATPSRRPADRPTSPWSASTCPAARAGRSSATADGGTVIFFSMATSFSAAALGAEGAGRRRDHARRQRLHARPRGVRPGAAARQRRRARPVRAETVMATSTRPRRGALDLDPATVRKARGAGPQGRPADRQDRPAAHHRVRRARDAAAGRPRGRRRRGHAVGQPPRRLRPRRRRARARRRAARSGTPYAAARAPTCASSPRRRPPARSGSGCPRARTPTRATTAARRQVGRRHQADRRAPQGARAADRQDRRRPGQAVDLPDRRHRRHLRGHPAGAGRRPRGRRHHRGDPLDRAEPARLRARGRDPRGLRRHLRHAGELPADAGGPRRDVARSSAATCG